MKLCRDCKWFVGYDTCECPKNREHHPVTGVSSSRNGCYRQRLDGLVMSFLNSTCGCRGRWYSKRMDLGPKGAGFDVGRF